jgi:predicted neuraminidase
MKLHLPALCLFGISCAFAAGPSFEAQAIFPPQSLHAHSSSIVELPDGRLMTCWYIGSGERSADDVQVQASYLRPGAGQWDPPFTLADTPGFPDTNPVLFVDRDNRLWLLWATILDNRWEGALLKLRIAADGGKQQPVRWDYSDNMLLIPRDFAAKVSPVLTDLAASLPPGKDKAEAAAAIGNSSNKLLSRLGWMPRIHPLQLRSGRVLVPLYSDTYNLSLIAITDDGGLNWKASEPLVSLGGVQPSLVVRKDGTIVAYMRDNGPPPQRALVGESHDDGATWSAIVDSDIPNPGSSLEVIVLRDGSWCMVLNDTEDGRHRLSVWLSEDEGKTWPWRRTLENHPPKTGGYSYPSLIQTRDGFIHVTYSSSSREAPAAPELQTIKHARFTSEWVKQAGGAAAK